MSEFYQSGDAKLGFEMSGTGLPVFFLHPTPLNRDYWFPLIRQVAGIHAIIPDLRGHGVSELGSDLPVGTFSRVPDAPALTMGQLATDVLTLLDHLQLSSAVFIGCSIGGYVMLEIWRRAPHRMRGMAFVCSKPQPDAEANLAKRAENIVRARSGEMEALIHGMAQNLVSASTRDGNPEMVAELRSQMKITPKAFVAVQAGLASRPDSVPTVATISVPILAIAGREDTAVSPAEMEAFGSSSGEYKYHVLADAGHFAAYEQPRVVAALVAPWLRQFEV